MQGRLAAVVTVGLVFSLQGIRGAASAAGDPFSDDDRFMQTVSAAESDRPLGTFLHELRRTSGLPVRASHEVEDDQVTVQVGKMPARDLLLGLAQEHEFRWVVRGDTYILDETPELRQRQAQARNDDLSARLLQIEHRMSQESQLVELAPTKLASLRKESQEKTEDAAADGGERARAREQLAAIDELGTAGGHAAAIVHRELSVQELATLRQTGMLKLVTRSLPAEQKGKPTPPDGWLSDRAAAAAHEAAQAGKTPVLPLAYCTVFFRLRTETVGPPPVGAPNVRLEAVFLSLGESGKTRRSGLLTWSPDFPAPEPEPAPKPEPARDALLSREVNLALQAGAPEKPAPKGLVGFSSLPAYFGGGAWPQDTVPLSAVLAALHRTAGLDCISDSYVRARLPMRAVSGRRSLRALLDGISRELHYRWTLAGNCLRFHSLNAHWDRPMQVPERVLAPWRAQLSKGAAPDLDSLGALALKLDDLQARGLQDYWGWYLDDARFQITPPGLPPNGFCGLRQHLRLWGGLSPQQRSAALAGAPLRVGDLTPSQQRLFTAALAGDPISEWYRLRLDLSAEPAVQRAQLLAMMLKVRESRAQWQLCLGTRADGTPVSYTTTARLDSKVYGPSDEEGHLLATPTGPIMVISDYSFDYLDGSEALVRHIQIHAPGQFPRSQGGKQ